MKKTILVIICIIIIALVIFFNWYITNKKTFNEINSFNNYFISYIEDDAGKSKSITGIQLTTLMNKAIDNNEQYNLKKSENGAYILNNENSLEILIKVDPNGDYYLMEAYAISGMTSFTTLYGGVEFECVKKEFHQNGKISKLIFEILE